MNELLKEATELLKEHDELQARIKATIKDCDEKTGTMRAELKNGNSVSDFATNENILI